jgi:fatty acid desaturase
MIGFVCCGCGAELQIGDEWRGKLGRCPHCRATTRLPGNPKRTSKLTILARFFAWPVVVLSFWTFFLGWPVFLGGMIAVAIGLFGCWAFTNLVMFFDCLDSPLNNDPPSVRFQEMYREKARQECEEVDRQFGIVPAPAPDTMKDINDPNVI